MRRILIALILLLISATAAQAWPPALDEFCLYAMKAAPPGWELRESDNLLTAGDCAPQLVCIFREDGAFLEYRLDLDNPEPDDDQADAQRTKLDGRAAIYLQEGEWQRFTYLTVYLPDQVASLTIGVNQKYTLDEMKQLYYAFPLADMLSSSGKKAK